MKGEDVDANKKILCATCSVPLEPRKVTVRYLKSAFPAELLGCPVCGQVYVSEELAMGKMAEVERTLEDK